MSMKVPRTHIYHREVEQVEELVKIGIIISAPLGKLICSKRRDTRPDTRCSKPNHIKDCIKRKHFPWFYKFTV